MTQQQQAKIKSKILEWVGGVFKPANALQILMLLFICVKMSYNGTVILYTSGRAFVDTVRTTNARCLTHEARIDTLEGWKRQVTSYYLPKQR